MSYYEHQTPTMKKEGSENGASFKTMNDSCSNSDDNNADKKQRWIHPIKIIRQNIQLNKSPAKSSIIKRVQPMQTMKTTHVIQPSSSSNLVVDKRDDVKTELLESSSISDEPSNFFTPSSSLCDFNEDKENIDSSLKPANVRICQEIRKRSGQLSELEDLVLSEKIQKECTLITEVKKDEKINDLPFSNHIEKPINSTFDYGKNKDENDDQPVSEMKKEMVTKPVAQLGNNESEVDPKLDKPVSIHVLVDKPVSKFNIPLSKHNSNIKNITSKIPEPIKKAKSATSSMEGSSRKLFKSYKGRIYDTEEIRKFMNKKRLERIAKEKEERKKKEQENQIKKRKLEYFKNMISKPKPFSTLKKTHSSSQDHLDDAPKVTGNEKDVLVENGNEGNDNESISTSFIVEKKTQSSSPITDVPKHSSPIIQDCSQLNTKEGHVPVQHSSGANDEIQFPEMLSPLRQTSYNFITVLKSKLSVQQRIEESLTSLKSANTPLKEIGNSEKYCVKNENTFTLDNNKGSWNYGSKNSEFGKVRKIMKNRYEMEKGDLEETLSSEFKRGEISSVQSGNLTFLEEFEKSINNRVEKEIMDLENQKMEIRRMDNDEDKIRKIKKKQRAVLMKAYENYEKLQKFKKIGIWGGNNDEEKQLLSVINKSTSKSNNLWKQYEINKKSNTEYPSTTSINGAGGRVSSISSDFEKFKKTANKSTEIDSNRLLSCTSQKHTMKYNKKPMKDMCTSPIIFKSDEEFGIEYSRRRTSLENLRKIITKDRLSNKMIVDNNNTSMLKILHSSESDDSTLFSHTTSDQSDIEIRIAALREQLRQRKLEADKLRNTQKLLQREKLKSKEQSIIKQIQAYDAYIDQMRNEIDEMTTNSSSDVVTITKPQIKRPIHDISRRISGPWISIQDITGYVDNKEDNHNTTSDLLKRFSHQKEKKENYLKNGIVTYFDDETLPYGTDMMDKTITVEDVSYNMTLVSESMIPDAREVPEPSNFEKQIPAIPKMSFNSNLESKSPTISHIPEASIMKYEDSSEKDVIGTCGINNFPSNDEVGESLDPVSESLDQVSMSLDPVNKTLDSFNESPDPPSEPSDPVNKSSLTFEHPIDLPKFEDVMNVFQSDVISPVIELESLAPIDQEVQESSTVDKNILQDNEFHFLNSVETFDFLMEEGSSTSQEWKNVLKSLELLEENETSKEEGKVEDDFQIQTQDFPDCTTITEDQALTLPVESEKIENLEPEENADKSLFSEIPEKPTDQSISEEEAQSQVDEITSYKEDAVNSSSPIIQPQVTGSICENTTPDCDSTLVSEENLKVADNETSSTIETEIEEILTENEKDESSIVFESKSIEELELQMDELVNKKEEGITEDSLGKEIRWRNAKDFFKDNDDSDDAYSLDTFEADEDDVSYEEDRSMNEMMSMNDTIKESKITNCDIEEISEKLIKLIMEDCVREHRSVMRKTGEKEGILNELLNSKDTDITKDVSNNYIVELPSDDDSSSLDTNSKRVAEELRKQQMKIEQEIEELQAQQVPPYVYFREIPNKPPPPYKPSNSKTSIPNCKEKLMEMIELAAEEVFKSMKNENDEFGGKYMNSNNDVDPLYKKFLFELTLEIFNNVKNKKFKDEGQFSNYIKKQGLILLGKMPKVNKENWIVKWSRQKRTDFVDDLLIQELQDDETEWKNYENDEEVVLKNLTENIMNELIGETAILSNNAINHKLRD